MRGRLLLGDLFCCSRLVLDCWLIVVGVYIVRWALALMLHEAKMLEMMDAKRRSINNISILLLTVGLILLANYNSSAP